MILTTSRFTPEPTNEQMQSTETYHQKVIQKFLILDTDLTYSISAFWD